MTAAQVRSVVGRVLQQRHLNFALTNLVPRRRLTLWMARFSRIRHPWVARPSIAIWRFFADVDLADARESHFASLHECFTRELRAGARPVDTTPQVLVSPCDGIVGASGVVSNGLALQAKGRSYPLAELLGDEAHAEACEGGRYVTLRLTAGMYHRFHAPERCTIEQVDYIPGDTWNVNPATLGLVDRLYCRNERAVMRCRLAGGECLTLVPVAAILVASLRLHCLARTLNLCYDGPSRIHTRTHCERGEELGWFEHGSTIIVLVPRGFELAPGIVTGSTVRMGVALLERTGMQGASF